MTCVLLVLGWEDCLVCLLIHNVRRHDQRACIGVCAQHERLCQMMHISHRTPDIFDSQNSAGQLAKLSALFDKCVNRVRACKGQWVRRLRLLHDCCFESCCTIAHALKISFTRLSCCCTLVYNDRHLVSYRLLTHHPVYDAGRTQASSKHDAHRV